MTSGGAAALLNNGALAIDIQEPEGGHGHLAEIEWAGMTRPGTRRA